MRRAADEVLDELLLQAWTALSTEPILPASLAVTGEPGHLPSRFRAEDAAVACVGAALLAARALHESRGGSSLSIGVDRGQVAAAVRSERYFCIRGRLAGPAFAPLSRFFQAADGWVRTHANYPWHRDALLRALGANDDAESVADAIAKRGAEEVEARVVESGGVAGAVRSHEQWRAHSQGQAVAAEPLVLRSHVADADPRQRAAGSLPASGVRVLDLTRVIAGPVATRFLGALGADVLRVDPPGLPDLEPGAPSDSLLAKRSTLLDLASPGDRGRLHALLDEADALVCGYRPGCLERFGLGVDEVARLHPGLVVVSLDAWGHSGPWARRRGFDSIVQAVSGIAVGESAGRESPGALPCQLLDHGTGYLAAAAVLEGLRSQAMRGGTQLRYLSLARTALWLVSAGASTPTPDWGSDQKEAPARWLVEVSSDGGPVEVVTPPGQLGGQMLRWPAGLSSYGSGQPEWLRR